MQEAELLALADIRPDWPAPLGCEPGLPGWVTDGIWAVRLESEPEHAAPMPTKKRGALAKLVAGAKRATWTPMREVPELHMAREELPCPDCEGTDSAAACECPRMAWEGQVVYESPSGERTVLDPKYRPLLEGMRVVRLDGAIQGPLDSPERRPLGGVGEDGLVVIVMPLREPPRSPGATP